MGSQNALVIAGFYAVHIPKKHRPCFYMIFYCNWIYLNFFVQHFDHINNVCLHKVSDAGRNLNL